LKGSGSVEAAVQPDTHVIVLLALRRLRPKMQVFARCRLAGTGQPECFETLPTLPFTIQVATRESRLNSRFRSLDLLTSDELALRLGSLRCSWSLFSLSWTEIVEATSLLPLRVVAIGDEFVCRPKSKRSKGPDLCSLLDSWDGPGPSNAPAVPESHHEDDDNNTDDDDDDGMDGVPEEIVLGAGEDLADALREQQVADQEIAEALLAHGETVDNADSASDDDIDSLLDGPEGEGHDAVESGGQVVEGAVVEAYRSAVLDDTGYISSELEPWSHMPSVGRLTFWPKGAAPDKQNVSCKCFLHVGCTTPARRRNKVSTEVFLKWLFAGACEPLCPRSRSEELAREHKRLFAQVVDGAAAESASTSSVPV
jgi:hypothetical protein